MEKIKLSEICGYLPYGLSINNKNEELRAIVNPDGVETLFRGHLINYYELEEIKPILSPLKDIYTHKYKPKYAKGMHVISEIIPMYYLEMIKIGQVKEIPYDWFELLLKEHFDVYGLINRGLAIDINSLK